MREIVDYKNINPKITKAMPKIANPIPKIWITYSPFFLEKLPLLRNLGVANIKIGVSILFPIIKTKPIKINTVPVIISLSIKRSIKEAIRLDKFVSILNVSIAASGEKKISKIDDEKNVYVTLPLEPEVTKNVAPLGLSGWDLHEYEMSQWETTKPDKGGITFEEEMDLLWGGTNYDWRKAYGW